MSCSQVQQQVLAHTVQTEGMAQEVEGEGAEVAIVVAEASDIAHTDSRLNDFFFAI